MLALVERTHSHNRHVGVPVGNVSLHLNFFYLRFQVTGVRGQLAKVRGHDPRWLQRQLDSDKNGCTVCGAWFCCFNRAEHCLTVIWQFLYSCPLWYRSSLRTVSCEGSVHQLCFTEFAMVLDSSDDIRQMCVLLDGCSRNIVLILTQTQLH